MKHHILKSCAKLIPIPGLLWGAFCVLPAHSQGVPRDNVRQCAADFDKGLAKKNNSPRQNRKQKEEPTSRPVCLEVRGSSLIVQEYLQKLMREFRWNVNDEQASEDLWSFSMMLSAEELLAYAKPFSDPRIEWSAGKASVNVRTTELPEGFVRVVITARFDGYGSPEDKFAPKRESWPLPSSGALEGKMAEAIKEHFKTGH